MSDKGPWPGAIADASVGSRPNDAANAGIRREPELPEHEDIAPEPARPVKEFDLPEDADETQQALSAGHKTARTAARRASLDRGTGMDT